MNLAERYTLRPLMVVGILCLAIGLAGGLFLPTPIMKMVQLGFAFFLYCVVPGYFMLLTFKMDNIERIVMSIGVSVAVVSVTLHNLNFIGVKISQLSTLAVIFGYVLVGIVIYERKSKKN